ncbi:hypothetical protein [Mucilaginibacter sp.]|uniref:hypothetical protein n=1 Tax=Mucilaginibacter sp. TaxID=1882438 RepID=UPI003D0BF935
MQFFLADYIHPQKLMGYTTEISKIASNLSLVKPLADNVKEKAATGQHTPFTQMTVSGRWIVVYTANGVNDEDTMMYFTDFRVELDASAISHMVSANSLGNMKVLQFRYDGVYKDTMDVFDITYCNTGERILKSNLVVCDSDQQVLDVAKALNVLPMITSVKDSDKIKVVMADEKIEDGDILTVNAFALIRFAKTATEQAGFGYLKLYDLTNNYALIDDFAKALEQLGGKFDRAVFVEKFNPVRWN